MGKINYLIQEAINYLGYVLIGLGIIFSLLFVWNGDVIFHTDIARDFMLIQEMVETGKPTLIGPKIGPIQGLFHGPLWLYLNLPTFLIGGGNPVIVGWGWIMMGVLFLYSVYYTVTKIYGKQSGIIATVVTSSSLAFYSHQLFNPSGAVMLTPIMFYLYWKYFQNYESKYLFYLSIVLGCIIHFQIAFGLPMTILIYLSVVLNSLRIKKYYHPLLLLSILIPLSTYIIFELRHDFFQTKSAITYLTTQRNVDSNLLETFQNRKINIMNSSYGLLNPKYTQYDQYLYLAFYILILFKTLVNKNSHSKSLILAIYLILGYWLLSMFYRGVFESYYYQPLNFLSLMIFASAFAIKSIPKYLSLLLFIPIIFLNFKQSKVASFATYDYSGNHASSWQYNLDLANSLYLDSEGDFGYFILSEDLLAYSPKYAILYARKLYADKNSYIFEKKPITYVIVSNDTYKQGSIDVRWWEEGQVRIAKTPVKTWDYRHAYTIKKYLLTEEEVKIPKDPNLLQGISFR